MHITFLFVHILQNQNVALISPPGTWSQADILILFEVADFTPPYIRTRISGIGRVSELSTACAYSGIENLYPSNTSEIQVGISIQINIVIT